MFKQFYDAGVSIIPSVGKRPCVAWKRYTKKQVSLSTLYKWSKQFKDCNVAIVTGKVSNVIVIDCDDSNLTLEVLEQEFGETKLAVRTPRGGLHLYYSYNNEKSFNYAQRKIELKSDNSLITAPYSHSVDGVMYEIIKGSIYELCNLTRIKGVTRQVDKTDFTAVVEGNRNNSLFCGLRQIASSIKSLESLVEKARGINCCFSEPLEESEIIAVARSVWRLKVTGNIYCSERYTYVSQDEIHKLRIYPKAFYLLSYLRLHHCGEDKYFCIDQEKVSKSIALSRKTLRKNINALLEAKFLFRKSSNKNTYNPSIGKKEPYQYRLYGR